MGFLAPWMLLGTLAASIPVILHLFYRSRYRVVAWAAMEFLLASIQQTSRRLKFQELLLLLLRVAVLLLLALALARPTFTASANSGQGEAVKAILVIDNSLTMGAREGARTRLDQAKDAASAVLDGLPPNSTVQILTLSDRAAVVGPRSPSNLDQARQVIEGIKPSSRGTDFLPAAVEALAALRQGHASGNREVYLFSDMQRLGWEEQEAGIKDKFEALRREANVFLVRCGTRVPRNATLVGILPPQGLPHTGERSTFTVLVRNSGTEPLRDLTVTLEVDGKSAERDARTLDVLKAGETRPVPLTAKLDRAGLQPLTATVGPDEMDGDNRYDLVLDVKEQVRVLVIDGIPNETEPEKSGSYFLVHNLVAVAPRTAQGESVVNVRVVPSREASSALLEDRDLCVLVNVPLASGAGNEGKRVGTDFTERLARFVRDGKGLMVFVGPDVNADAYNAQLLDKQGLLPLRLGKGVTAPQEQPFNLDVKSIDPSSYLAGFREKPLSQLGQADVLRILEGSVAGDGEDAGRVLVRYSNGMPALATRHVGRGEVLLSTTSADLRWGFLPLHPMIVPWFAQSASYLLQSPVRVHNRKAGEPLVWYPSRVEEEAEHIVRDQNGDETKVGTPQTVQGRATVTYNETSQAGVYGIAALGESEALPPPTYFAVVPSSRETEDLDTLGDNEIDERLGFRPLHLFAGQDPSSLSTARLNREWTVWVLGIVLALALAEVVLAWFCGRSW